MLVWLLVRIVSPSLIFRHLYNIKENWYDIMCYTWTSFLYEIPEKVGPGNITDIKLVEVFRYSHGDFSTHHHWFSGGPFTTETLKIEWLLVSL